MEYEMNRSQLTITIDSEDREMLSENPDWNDDEVLMKLGVYDGELSPVYSYDTGDLTDAPLIGILTSDEEPDEHCGEAGCGRFILERWGFMDYALISVRQRLLDEGSIVFISQN